MRTLITHTARVGSVLGEVASTRTFVCRDCVARGAAITFRGQRRNYAEKKDNSLFSQQGLRRRIWGTDNPPGPEDVYQSQSQVRVQDSKDSQPAEESALETAEDLAPAFDGSTVEQAKEFDPDYEPATNWEGLERIGGAKGWWEKSWDEENPFHRWSLQTVRELDPRTASNYIHRAYVELKVLQEAGIDLNDVSFIPLKNEVQYQQVKPIIQENGSVQLEFPTNAQHWRQELIDSLSADEGEFVQETTDAATSMGGQVEAVVEEMAETSAEEAATEEYNPPVGAQSLPTSSTPQMAPPKYWGDVARWRHIKLNDPAFKFALSKRLMQLTGSPIPDHALNRSDELGLLMQLGFRYKAPKKLSTELMKGTKEFKGPKEPVTVANVTIHPRRVTYVDKENKLGRWKTIQKELSSRGLPLPQRRRSKY